MSTSDPLREPIDHGPAADDESARSQQFDRALRAALNDLPVPAGLADRLMAANAAESAPLRSPPPAKTENADARNHRRYMSRRTIMLATGSLALVGLIAISVATFWRPQPVIAQQELGGEVTGWLAALQPKNWHPAATTALPKG